MNEAMKDGDSRDGLVAHAPRREHTFSRFYEIAKKYPENVAIHYLGSSFSYAKLHEHVERFAAALHELGVGRQDRVMLYLSNCPQWVIASFAVQRIGAVLVPVSPIYTAHELAYMVEDAGVETIVCQDTNFGYVHEIFGRTGLRRVVVTGLADMLPGYKRVLGNLLDKIPHGKVAQGKHIHRFRELLRHAPNEAPEVEIDAVSDLAQIMYTGGTTGDPKGVPANHLTEVSYVRDIMDDVLAARIEEGKDRLLVVAPLCHIMGRGFLIAAGLNWGNATVLMPIFHLDELLASIERHRIRWLLGVPTLYRMVLESERVDQYELRSLKYCYCGGDVLPAEVFARWKELTGVPIYQVYGSTEVGHVAYSRLDREPSPDVIGPPLPSYSCRIVHPETLEPVPEGEVGELLVTADFVVKSYWRKPAETERSYVNVGGEVFYRMGDLVRQGADGELQFVERTADVIKCKGYRVSASEVEAVLQDHPTVVAACVVGVQDERVGERVKAIVVLKHDAKGVSGGDLTLWCKKRLAPYKVPSYIEFRDMLPKSKVGKLLRREIRDEERRKARG